MATSRDSNAPRIMATRVRQSEPIARALDDMAERAIARGQRQPSIADRVQLLCEWGARSYLFDAPEQETGPQGELFG